MDASVELIRAVFDRLRTTTAITDYLDDRFFDPPPQRQDQGPPPTYPYLSLGPSTSIPEDYDCLDGEEITIQLDIWTSGAGEANSSVQCRKICGAIKRALHDADLPLTDNAMISLQHELTRILDDPNPAIHHGAIQFTATVELH